MTGPALEDSLMVTRIAPLWIWLGHVCNIARSRRQWMRLVAVAALWNVLRIVRDIAVWSRLVAIWPQVVGRGSDEFIERSVAPQANLL